MAKQEELYKDLGIEKKKKEEASVGISGKILVATRGVLSVGMGEC